MTGRKYEFKPTSDRINQYQLDKEIRDEIFRNKLPFITPDFLPDFFLSQGLILIGGQSGQAKSTTCANIVAGFLAGTDKEKQCIVISNEENADAIYERIACCILNLNFKDSFLRKLSPMQEAQLLVEIEQVAKRVEVVSDEEQWKMSCLEDVQDVIDSASEDDRYSLICIDYLQTITYSRVNESMPHFEVLKNFGLFMKDRGRSIRMPVITFAQLNPDGKGFTERVQYDKSIFNHAFLAIELQPDFKTSHITFRIHKDRFMGTQGKDVVMKYHGGKYYMPHDTNYLGI